jgi:hypothetical protein
MSVPTSLICLTISNSEDVWNLKPSLLRSNRKYRVTSLKQI